MQGDGAASLFYGRVQTVHEQRRHLLENLISNRNLAGREFLDASKPAGSFIRVGM